MTDYFTIMDYVTYLKLPSGEELEVVGSYEGGGSYTIEKEDDGRYINKLDQPEFDFNLVYELEDKTRYTLTRDQEKDIKCQFTKQYWERLL